jgi:aspartate kinase
MNLGLMTNSQNVRSDYEERLKLDTSHTGMFMDAMKAAGEDNSANW